MVSIRFLSILKPAILLIFSSTIVLGCGEGEIELYIRNKANNPFHIVDDNGKNNIRIPENGICLVKSFSEDNPGYDTVILYLMRNELNWARLNITPLKYPEDELSNYFVFVTITEDTRSPPFTFHASVWGDELSVSLENLIP